jgi:two-component system NtrC family sensor kinase
VVRGLLDFARQRPFARIETQVNDVLKSTINLLAYEIRTHNIDIVEHLAPDLPTTLADPHQLQQVFVNLFTNAIQAIDKSEIGGHLTITSKVTKSSFLPETQSQDLPVIHLMIQNNGPAIPAEIQSRIFDPFFTTKEPGKGTGLGLSVCHGIISNHNGDIWVKSKDGEGTTFFIELPIITASKENQTNHRKQVTSQSATLPNGEPRILVVDDEEGVLMVITRILRRNGYQVDDASNGKVALDLLENSTYDLVLCDLRMPEMGGAEFYWKAVEKYPELENRVIFTTGDTVSANTREFLNSVNAQCLLKPFELDNLLAVVQERLCYEL